MTSDRSTMEEALVTDVGTVQRSVHENKFDRQIRLWGHHGQSALERARVLVLGAGPLGTETLKNLILPNVQRFTLVDNMLISVGDVGNNFFVTPETVGQPRAEVAVRLLEELNPSAKGTAIVQDPIAFVQHGTETMLEHSIVVATQLPDFVVAKAAKILYECGIPLVHVKAFGLLGSVRVAIREHRIVESHPDNDRGTDLFLHPSQLAAFPELDLFLSRIDIGTTDDFVHEHIPFLAFLAQCGKEWSKSHNGEMPQNAKEMEEFRQLIRSKAMPEHADNPNILEALQSIHHAVRSPSLRIDPGVTATLNDDCAKSEHLNLHTDPFWILVNALQQFMQNEGRGLLPATLELPDMTTDSTTYVQIGKLFKSRFERDVSIITRYAKATMRQLGRDMDKEIPKQYIQRFVKNARNLAVQRIRSFEQESSCDLYLRAQLDELLQEEDAAKKELEEGSEYDPAPVHWYIAMRAAEEFRSALGRYPGDVDDSPEQLTRDFDELCGFAHALLGRLSIPASRLVKDTLEEVYSYYLFGHRMYFDLGHCNRVRFGSSQIHNTAALLGAVAAQSTIKFLTAQYVVLNNTVIWDGIHGKLTAFEC